MEQQVSNGGLQYVPQIEEQYTALDSNEALINRNSTINSTGHSAEINTITVSAEENTTAGSAAFSIFAVSQTENAFIAGFDDLTWDTFSEGYDGYYFQHEDIIDAEKCTSITQDNMMCWAATASNMLYYTEWLLQDTTNEDEIFTVFVDNFREGKRYGGNAYYAVQWYFTGSYTPSGWSEWDKPYANTGDYFDNITISSYLSSKNATTSNFTLAVEKLQDGYAVGLSFGYYNTAGERTGGHAITLWGMTYDTSLSVTDPNYYTGIIVTDSDDDKGYYGDPLAAPDTLKIISITYDSSKKQYILDPDYAGNNCIVETLHFLAPNPGFTPNAEPVDSAVKIYNSSEVVSRTKSVADKTLASSGEHLMRISSGGTADNTTINAGGSLYISSAGRADNTQIYKSGRMYISCGGTANSTTINSGGSMYISSGGTANSTTGNSGGYMYIFSGGVANDTTINSGGWMYISSGGVANDTTINTSGRMYIFSGGVANDTTINSGGYMYISSGGVANDTTVNSGDYMYISSGGVADSTTVNSGGRVYIDSGCVANSTTVNSGGRLNINSGGTAAEILENGGYVYVEDGANVTFASNTISGLVLSNGGSMTVHSNTIANSTTVNSGGRMYIERSGGVANDTTVNDGGRMYISSGGVANSTTVNAGGYMYISSGGTASSTTVNSGGEMRIYSGGVANSTTVSGGYMYISSDGVANSTTVNDGGRMYISSGGVANSTTVSGGNMWISNGGVAISTTVNSGGMYIYSGGVANSTTINSGGNMYISSGGTANSTTANGSIFIFSGGTANSTTVNSGGSMRISGYGGSAATASNTTVNSGGGVSAMQKAVLSNTVINAGGSAELLYSGSAYDTTISSGGVMTAYYYKATALLHNVNVSSGGMLCFGSGTAAYNNGVKVTGTLNLAGTLFVTEKSVDMSEATVNLILTDRSAEDDYIINGFEKMTSPTYTITVSADQEYGTYKLAQGAENFAGSISVGDGSVNFGSVAVNGKDLIHAQKRYSLDRANGKLTLSVSEADTTPPELTVSCNPPGWTNKSVTLTVSANEDCSIQYQVNNGSWIGYSAGGIEINSNCEINFKATDLQGNITEKSFSVGNIDTKAPVVSEENLQGVVDGSSVTYDFTDIFSDNLSGIQKYIVQWISGKDLSLIREFSTTSSVYSTGAIEDGKYYLDVTAIDNAGNKSTKKKAHAVVIDTAPPTVPQNVVVTNSKNSVTVTWSPSTDAGIGLQKYVLQISSDVSFSNIVQTQEISKTSYALTLNDGKYYFRVKAVDYQGKASNWSQSATVIIDSAAPEAPVAKADITSATNLNVTVTATFSADSTVKEFSLNNKDWNTYSSAVIMTANGTVYFRGKDEAGNYSPVTSYEVNNIDKVAPNKPTANADITTVTNLNVTVTATFSSDSVVKEFSLNNKDWKTYTAGVVFEENGTVYFRGKDEAGNYSPVTSYEVNNIDKVAPEAPVAKADITKVTNQNVTVTATFSADSTVKEFSLNNKDWKTYTAGIVFEENGTVYFRGKDEAGNYSPVTSYSVNNIDKAAPDAPVAKANISAATNLNVTVSASFSSDCVVKEYSLNYKDWNTYSSAVIMTANGTVYFRGKDEAGNVSAVTSYEVYNIDKVAPEVPASFTGNVSNYSAKLDWSDAVDGGTSGIKGYYFRYGTSKTLSGNSSFVSESGKTLSNLAVGTWYYQVKAVDNAGNTSAWSAIQTFSVAPGKVQNLQGSSNGLSWTPVAGVNGYTVEFSKDNFKQSVTLKTTTAAVDFLALPPGSYQVRVKADNGLYSDSKNISVNASAQAQIFFSDSDGNTDVFFASGNSVWENGYAARHQGVLNRWLGTETQVMLAGKNRLDDVFCGSNDANVLIMTDDANGDALFLDDIYTSLGNQARLSQIDEIRAGFGDDIVDLTSQRYAYSGHGLTIYGGSGNDTIWANCGSNTLFGDSGSDNLIGGSDNDILIGGSGNDSMHGGGGDDIFCFGGNWGTDTIEQLADGKVTLWFENGSARKWNASTLTYSDGVNSVSVIGTTQITLKFGNDSALPAGAFDDIASEKIFEDKNKGMLA